MHLLPELEDLKSYTRPDDDYGDTTNVVTDVQGQGAVAGGEVEQWQLECIDNECCYDEQHDGNCYCQCELPVINCCANCSGGCHDDDEISTFYVNYQHQRATVDGDDLDEAPTITGVQVCGPASYELLFLIDQLASCLLYTSPSPRDS